MKYFCFWTDEFGTEDGRQQRDLIDAKKLAVEQSRKFPAACVVAMNANNDEVGTIDYVRGKIASADGVFLGTVVETAIRLAS